MFATNVLFLVSYVTAQSFIRTVDQCKQCLNAAGSQICSGNPSLFTTVCCSSADATRDCNTANSIICQNNMADLSSITSQYLLCPSPRECGQTDFSISNFDTELSLSFTLIPSNSYCRVRIFTDVNENYKIHLTNIDINQASIEIFESDPRPSENFRFTSVANLSASTSVEFNANIHRRNNLYMILTPGSGLEGRFSATISLSENSNKDKLHYLEYIFIVVACVLVVIFLTGLVIFCYMVNKENAGEKAERLKNDVKQPLKSTTRIN